MSELLLPQGTVPSNLRLREGTSVKLVTRDLFHIADRVREISDRLYILELAEDSAEGQKFGLAIMEHTPDRGDYLVFRLPVGDLDGRVLDRLRYMMSVPLHTRLAILDKEREKWEHEREETALEELWENMGGQMWVDLEKYGFVDGRGVSYRPMNPTARRAGRKM